MDKKCAYDKINEMRNRAFERIENEGTEVNKVNIVKVIIYVVIVMIIIFSIIMIKFFF